MPPLTKDVVFMIELYHISDIRLWHQNNEENLRQSDALTAEEMENKKA